MIMPHHDHSQTPSDSGHLATPLPAALPLRGFFQLPPAVKRVFDQFPRAIHEANSLPQRVQVERREHVLHIFAFPDEARRGRPSYNPACLKWQTYLKFCGLSFQVISSNNHASPTGVLPFLQPGQQSDTLDYKVLDPIPSNKLKRWLVTQASIKDVVDIKDARYEVYTSLLNNRIRKAWLFQLYLTPQNGVVLRRLYVDTCSSSLLVQIAVLRQLRSAAGAELVKSTDTTDVSASDLTLDAEDAFQAISGLLGSDLWFFGQSQPGLFDASLFAYTHLLLDAALGWICNPLREKLCKLPNLVQHHDRIADIYYA